MKQRSASITEISSILKITPITSSGVALDEQQILKTEIQGLNLCNRETRYNSILSYATNESFSDYINNNKAVKALIVSHHIYEIIKEKLSPEMIYWISPNPEYTFYDLHNYLWFKTIFYDHYDFQPIIGKNCNIHNSVVIENGVVIKDNVTIGPNSVIRSGSIIESDVIIGCCTVIGSEGFQAIRGYTKHIKHVGGTHIKCNVFIGDNTTIGNEAFEGMVEIGENTQINNHVHIAHCCKVGKGCVITASVLMMGSTSISDNVWLAPNSVLMNKVKVSKNSLVGTLSLVTHNVEEGMTVVGIPAKKWE